MPEQDNLELSPSDKLGPTLFVIASVCAVVSIGTMSFIVQIPSGKDTADMGALAYTYALLLLSSVLMFSGLVGGALSAIGMFVSRPWRRRFAVLLLVNGIGLAVALVLTRDFWYPFPR